MIVRYPELCFEASVHYYHICYAFQRPRKEMNKIYLYLWIAPGGACGIDHVYVSRYQDFKKLLDHWTRDGWKYRELD